MASLNPHTRELVFKVVFYGPGLGGKTTTLQTIHAATPPAHRGKLISLATTTDRTLYFDYLPLRVPKLRGFNVRLQLFTVPGQVYYAATRKLVLSGADAVVFVADSARSRFDLNREALDDLDANLSEHGLKLAELPHTFHWNKRDLSDAAPVEELDAELNRYAAPALPTVATRGDGVFDGLERILRRVLAAHERAPLPGLDSPPADDEDGGGVSLHAAWGGEPRDAPAAAGHVSAPAPSAATSGRHAPPHGPSPGLSFARLFPEGERESVAAVEAMLTAADWGEAVLAADLLVARLLAQAGAMTAAHDAPRDPALVALLLGLPGERYLSFRAAVRAARHREPVVASSALQAYLVALELRTALARIGGV